MIFIGNFNALQKLNQLPRKLIQRRGISGMAHGDAEVMRGLSPAPQDRPKMVRKAAPGKP
ncbi:hypothetical protein A6U86_22590 [Rhizobium sp. AC27/96]|nr:hypothetical protein A6U86_22590 [Rhizobium sp. AC27/96]